MNSSAQNDAQRDQPNEPVKAKKKKGKKKITVPVVLAQEAEQPLEEVSYASNRQSSQGLGPKAPDIISDGSNLNKASGRQPPQGQRSQRFDENFPTLDKAPS